MLWPPLWVELISRLRCVLTCRGAQRWDSWHVDRGLFTISDVTARSGGMLGGRFISTKDCPLDCKRTENAMKEKREGVNKRLSYMAKWANGSSYSEVTQVVWFQQVATFTYCTFNAEMLHLLNIWACLLDKSWSVSTKQTCIKTKKLINHSSWLLSHLLGVFCHIIKVYKYRQH